jgi:hypothetical protein
MALPSLGTFTSNSTSVLRYGLLDIKPIEIKETIKRAGIKFIRITRSLESINPQKSYFDFIKLNNEAIFSTIEIPKWFDVEKLIEIFTKRSISFYEADVELKNAVENLKKDKGKPKTLLTFVSFVQERFESAMTDSLQNEALRFLNSNFPLSFFSKFVILDYTILDYLKLLKKIVRHYEIKSNMPRARIEFRIYSRVIENMKRQIAPLIDQMDACLFSYKCLKNYIDLWNSTSYEEIFKSKFLDANKLDSSKFNELYENFNSKHMETRKLLLDAAPEIFHRELSLEDEPTARMFSKIVNLPLPALTH